MRQTSCSESWDSHEKQKGPIQQACAMERGGKVVLKEHGKLPQRAGHRGFCFYVLFEKKKNAFSLAQMPHQLWGPNAARFPAPGARDRRLS